MKQGDLVTWKEGGIPELSGQVSTYLLLNPDPVRTNLTGESTWLALSCRGKVCQSSAGMWRRMRDER